MNEDNIPNETVPSEQPAPQVPGGSGAGHEIPTAFTSPVMPQPAQAPTPQGATFGIPTPEYQYGTVPGATVPITPITPIETKAAQKKSFGAGKVAALIVAASLVGGAAGLGTSYLGNTLWAQPAGTTASGPDSITVNNPGSVNETTAIATKVLPSVVTIEAVGDSESGSGSGVILSDDGYVLTNTHVVTLGGAAAHPTIRVTTSDGHIYNATIVGTDPVYDLAVIKLEDAKGLTPIDFADSSDINVGSTAVAVGAPLGLSNSVTTGIVSALNRSIQIASSALPESADQEAPDDQGDSGQESPFQFDLPGTNTQGATQNISIAVIQTDAAINPGNSGGALVDSEGNLIGINVAIATAGSAEESGSIGVGFAIPSNIAKRVSEEIIENGAATHGLLGATVQDAASDADADVAGAAIVKPTPGGAADEAGLKAGDIVTNFNGSPISNATDLTAQVRAAAAGSDATITYVRNGKSFEVDVTLGKLEL
ncbi:S1C family serine protease [Microbacterium sp. A93]|uniref:S1C family serine protease n=1 Tax=Microbacterium sp. A93 TaxID=3450716 RepID=UPI003F426173